MDRNEKELRTTLCFLLIAVTVAVYWQVANHDFLNYDDQAFVYRNPHVYTGLSVANLKWAFTTLHGDASYYHPLTWLTHQLDCQMFGLRAGAHHLTNLWFHLANAVLLFIALHNLTGKLWRSVVVSALFALHPLHIETVAWVSERKTLVCAFFWMLTLLAYVRYARRPGLLNYAVVMFLFVASLMSKPLAVTLPFVLLLLDFWPLGRIRLPKIGSAETGDASQPPAIYRFKQSDFLKLFVEKLPLLACAAIISGLTIVAQKELALQRQF